MTDLPQAQRARLERNAFHRRTAVGGHEGVARRRRRPLVVDGVDGADRCAHRREARSEVGQGGVLEEIPRPATPPAPLVEDISRQILAEPERAPGEIAAGVHQQRSDDAPQRMHPQSFERRHPAVPTRAGGEGHETLHLRVVRQQTKRVSAIGVPHHPQRRIAAGGYEVDEGGEIELRPVEVAHAETAQARRRRQSHATVVEGPDLMSARGGGRSEAGVEALRHGRGAGDDQVADAAPARGVPLRPQRVAVGRVERDVFCLVHPVSPP